MCLDSHIPRLVAAAWVRTAKNPTYRAWLSVAGMARHVANQLQADEPGSALATATERLATEAQRRAAAMLPSRAQEAA